MENIAEKVSEFYDILGNRIKPKYGVERISKDESIIEIITNITLVKPLGKFAELSDKYFWRHVIKNERSAKASVYGMMGLQAAAVLGVQYGLGLIEGNPDMVYDGLYAHLALDGVMVTLAPSWGRFKAFEMTK